MFLRQAGQSPLVYGRREFLRVGSGLAVASFLSPTMARGAAAATAQSPPGNARTCILVYLLGGPPHLDMWDLKPNAPAEVRGPFRPIATNVPGLQICEHLPLMAARADRYALVRSVSHNNHNHTPMIYFTLTGRPHEQPERDNDVRPPQRTDFPHVGAVIARFKRSSRGLPGYVAIPELAVRSSTEGEFKRARTPLRGGGSGFLGPRFAPLFVNEDPGNEGAVPALALPRDVSAGRLERRAALLSVLNSKGGTIPNTQIYGELRDQAVLLTGAAAQSSDIFSLAAEPPALRDRYGRHRLGRALLLARRLAEAEVPMVAIHFNNMTVCDGWDTHKGNFAALKGELLPMLDQGLSALLDDLGARGLLQQTAVVVMGEFGRTPKINADAGRDHWGSCQTVLLAGGGIKGGQVYGTSDKLAAFPASDPVDPADLHATVYQCMGIDPHAMIHDAMRRPFEICTGRAIQALL